MRGAGPGVGGWLAVAALAALPAPAAEVQAQAAHERIIGCYEIELGEWQPPLPEPDLVFHTPPGRFRLRTDSIDGIRLRAEPPIRHAFARGFARAWWEPLPGDSVRVVWSDNFTGAELRAVVAGDSLVGGVTARSDDIRPGPVPAARAIARRTECP